MKTAKASRNSAPTFAVSRAIDFVAWAKRMSEVECAIGAASVGPWAVVPHTFVAMMSSSGPRVHDPQGRTGRAYDSLELAAAAELEAAEQQMRALLAALDEKRAALALHVNPNSCP